MLDIGSGSGYLCAVLHHLVEDGVAKAKVVGIEHNPELVEWSTKNLKADGLENRLEDKSIEIIEGDGRLGIHPTFS